MSRRAPLPASMSVERARDAYLAENGFTLASYDAPWTPASLFGIPIAVPNTRAHKRAIKLHDLHHVATGYGTDLRGEAEISAWELAAGLEGLDLYVKSIVLSIVAAGVFLAPRRVLRAYRAGRRCRSLFDESRPYQELLGLTVGELRDRVHLPEHPERA